MVKLIKYKMNKNVKKIKITPKEITKVVYSSRKFMVIAVDGQYEYDINVDETDKGTLFSLSLSSGEQWSEQAKGELSMTMLNTGDGVIFSPPLNNLDYSQLNYVRLLTGLDVELSTNPLNKEKYSLIEVKEIIKL